jgi:phage terminase small subunit
MKKLSVKRQRFIEFYAGNGTDAARQAGYGGDDKTLNRIAYGLMRTPAIVEGIRAREDKRIAGRIMDREERQEFWTKVAQDEKESMKDRLNASRLLAKSECDFVSKAEVTYPDQIKYTEEEKKTLKRLALADARKRLSA